MAGITLTSSEPQLQNPEASAANASEPRTDISSKTDLWIFRDGKKQISGPEMLRHLRHRISDGAEHSGSLLDALIEAGELEAALADTNSPDAGKAAEVTDALAFAVCMGTNDGTEALRLASRIHPPDRISISPPEGFTYYALHPCDFVNVIGQISAEPRECALIGIRSIGTTLSAVSCAALKNAGRGVSRITVRPTGHPYDRRTEFTAEQMDWIRRNRSKSVQFLIIDEGPGRSGSTFLSVAEALLRAGVPKNLITIVGSRQPDPASLCADDAVARWNTFRFVSTTPSVNARFERCAYVGGGIWRQFANLEPWPESWTQMERLKFLSPDKKRLFKFEGMGPLGAEVRERAFVLADAGFSPHVTDTADGFLEYEWLKGHVLQADALTSSLLDRMAEYCAFRLANFATPQSHASELGRMLRFNIQQEFKAEFALDEDAFHTTASVLVDGRMQPYEWVALDDGKILKTDAISHGDDHFFPGPCDIAWDLAGIAIEWQLDDAACKYLLAQLRQLTGRDRSDKLRLYMIAYSVFRLGFCKMAISTVRGSDEERRLKVAYERYRRQARTQLDRLSGNRPLTDAA